MRLGDICHIEAKSAQEQATLAALELGPNPVAAERGTGASVKCKIACKLLGYNLAEHRFGGSPMTTVAAGPAATAPAVRNTAHARDRRCNRRCCAAQVEGSGDAWTVTAKISDELYAKLPTAAHLINVIGQLQAIPGEQLILVETLGRTPQRLQVTVDLQPAPLWFRRFVTFPAAMSSRRPMWNSVRVVQPAKPRFTRISKMWSAVRRHKQSLRINRWSPNCSATLRWFSVAMLWMFWCTPAG